MKDASSKADEKSICHHVNLIIALHCAITLGKKRTTESR